MSKGWPNDKERHSASSRGISTKSYEKYLAYDKYRDAMRNVHLEELRKTDYYAMYGIIFGIEDNFEDAWTELTKDPEFIEFVEKILLDYFDTRDNLNESLYTVESITNRARMYEVCSVDRRAFHNTVDAAIRRKYYDENKKYQKIIDDDIRSR